MLYIHRYDGILRVTKLNFKTAIFQTRFYFSMTLQISHTQISGAKQSETCLIYQK